MDAQELYLKDGRSAGVYYCAQCKRVSRTEEEAERCCSPNVCACGAECTRYYTSCKACIDRKGAEDTAALVAKARKVPAHEWDDPVWPDGSDGFASVAEALDHYDGEDEEMPWPVWGTREDRMRLGAEAIIDHATEEMYEGARDQIRDDAVRELQTLLDGWLAKHAPRPGYIEDSSIVITEIPNIEEDDRTEDPSSEVVDAPQAEVGRLREALAFYADPETYHSINFANDPPCGEFADDFDEHYGRPDYEGPWPGRRAREALLTQPVAEVGRLREAVAFYADPGSYHAIGVFFDHPCGAFAADFDEDHGNHYYNRPMPGRRAREAMRAQPTAEACEVDECEVCAVRDCPEQEPLHYHHDGCPACDLVSK